jgi:hypothetical protein
VRLADVPAGNNSNQEHDRYSELLGCILEVPGSNLVCLRAILTEAFHGCPQSRHENARIVSIFSHDRLLKTFSNS